MTHLTYWRGRRGSPVQLRGIISSILHCASPHCVPVKWMLSASSAFQGTYKASPRQTTGQTQCMVCIACPPHHARKTVGTISKRTKRIPSRIGTKAELSAIAAILVSIEYTLQGCCESIHEAWFKAGVRGKSPVILRTHVIRPEKRLPQPAIKYPDIRPQSVHGFFARFYMQISRFHSLSDHLDPYRMKK
jgi:hypothetical protein